MMFNPDYSIASAGIRQAQEVASRRGFVLVQAPVRQVDDIEAAITMLVAEHVHAVEVEPGAPIPGCQPEIAELMLQNRLPAASELRLLVETGGLFSYGPNIFNAAKRMAYLVDRILKGAIPADLPVEQVDTLANSSSILSWTGSDEIIEQKRATVSRCWRRDGGAHWLLVLPLPRSRAQW